MLTVLTGLCSSASFALSDMLSQKVARRAGVIPVVLWVFATGAVLLLPIALAVDGLPHGDAEWRAAGLVVLCGVIYVLGYGALLNGLRRGDLSLVTALTALQGAYVAVYAVASGEPVTAPLVVALVLAVSGGVLAAFQQRAKTAAGAGWGLIAGLIFATFFVLYDKAGEITWLQQAAFTRTTSFLVWVPVALLARKVKLPRESWGLAVGSGSLEVGGLVLIALAISIGPLAVAGVTASQFATFAVLLGLVVLKERPRPHQLAGVAMTLAAVTLLSVF
jgi:drug/metabolite transporter (DMT)-like permease